MLRLRGSVRNACHQSVNQCVNGTSTELVTSETTTDRPFHPGVRRLTHLHRYRCLKDFPRDFFTWTVGWAYVNLRTRMPGSHYVFRFSTLGHDQYRAPGAE